MKVREDLVSKDSPAGLVVTQLTDGQIPCSHIYMEAQVFSPDSSKIILRKGVVSPHGIPYDDPNHQYLLCDLDDKGKLIPLTDEINAIAPAYSPDGRYIYYFVDNSHHPDGKIEFKRVLPDGGGRELLSIIDSRIVLGGDYRLTKLYPLSTISSDGKKIVTSARVLNADYPEYSTWVVFSIDLQTMDVGVIWQDIFVLNAHPQFCRSKEEGRNRDVLIQHNHGHFIDVKPKDGNSLGRRRTDPLDTDLHILRDDGRCFRTVGIGRMEIPYTEHCTGHQCWRGRTEWVIASARVRRLDDSSAEGTLILVEALPIEHCGHLGGFTPNCIRNEITSNFENPMFNHFATDIEGRLLVSDYLKPIGKDNYNQHIYLMELGEPGKEPARRYTYILDAKTSWAKSLHIHPFLSPDGKRIFFNSAESGILHAYMAEGF